MLKSTNITEEETKNYDTALVKLRVYTIPVLVQDGPVGALLTPLIRLLLLICNGNPSANESGPLNLACIKW